MLLKSVKHMTSARAHFRPQGHNLNKFGKGPLGDATFQRATCINTFAAKHLKKTIPQCQACFKDS